MKFQKLFPTGRVKLYILNSILLGPVFTVLFYIVIYPTKGTFLHADVYKLWYCNGNNVIYSSVAFFIAMVLLYYRWRDQLRDFHSVEFLEKQLKKINRITKENGTKLLEEYSKYKVFVNGLLVQQRFARLMRHVETGSSWGETESLSKGMAAADLDAIESSHTWTRFLIWLIPIIGFIGTVLGIGLAIGGFNSVLEGAKGLDAMKKSLGGITNSLAYAFETTLVALYFDAALMIFLSQVQKQGDDLLEKIDAVFTDDVLAKIEHVDSGPAGTGINLTPEAIQIFGEFSKSADKLTNLNKLDSFEGTMISINQTLDNLKPVLENLTKKRSIRVIEEVEES